MLYSAKGHIEEELCSVIMPAYNCEKYIAEAIESVIKQTYKNWELIIVNDASTDYTEKIIKSYQEKDKRIKLILLSKNQGVANARNTAIQNAKGRYIAFLDADDYWEKEKLQKQIQILNNSNTDISYTAYLMIDEVGQIIKKRRVKESLNLKDLLKENSIIFSSVICKNDSIKNTRLKKEWYHEDYVFLLDLVKEDKSFKGIDEILMQYRVHRNGRSFNKLTAAKYRWKIYRKYLGISFLQSLYYLAVYTWNGIRKYKYSTIFRRS